MNRTITDIVLILSILFLPWWVSAALLLVACFYFHHFFEAFVFGIMADALYAAPHAFHNFPHLGVIFAAVSFLLSALIRERLAL
ncbi:MAG TPA: hypothetical protein VIR98_03535 [Candidatus Paceibacterota bacterium]|jgi:hypothetical protein